MSELEEPSSLQIDDLANFVPRTIEGTGLDFEFLTDLALKIVYADTGCTTEKAAQKLKLPRRLTASVIWHLYHEKFVDIPGTVGFQNDRYVLLERGRERVRRLLELNSYIGPAPVSLATYSSMIKWQERSRDPVKPQQVRAALADLVLSRATIQTLGLVVNSRRSLFIFGPSGNGKTTIAKALHAAQGGEIWIPYAVEVDGQVIRIFDSQTHTPIQPQPSDPHDERWIKIKRPLVITGGELTRESMDLTFNPAVRYFEAPFQMKANGGTLIIDDFGRQKVSPRDLLDRWIVPLEERIDYLTFHTGQKIQVPFDQLLVFATNLDPAKIVDEAFLRRMGYRLRVKAPTTETYAKVFKKYAESHGLKCDPKSVDVLFDLYRRDKREMKCCEPRDLIQRCIDICQYEDRTLEISPELLKIAWNNYFSLESD